MNKLIAILAMGICFSNVYAKGPKKDKTEEEGFVFTTVKENPITSIKIKTSRARAGRSLPSVSSNRNCSGWEKESSTCRKCSLYIIR